MKKTLCKTAFFVTVLSVLSAGNIGIVDFGKVMENSKYGKKEQQDFEAIRTQMAKGMEDLNKQLTETAGKLEDPEVLDSLSPEAEKELKMKFQALNEDMQRYQNQFYQVMQQANMKVMHTMNERVKEASKLVSKKNKKCTLILNKDAIFHMDDTHDMTDSVIAELDNSFATEESEKAEKQ